MNSSTKKKSQERFIKQQSYNIKLPISEGMFSKQHSIISQILTAKAKYSIQQHQTSKTTSELPLFRADTPNSLTNSVPFQSKYHFNSVSQLAKMDCNLSRNAKQDKEANQDTSADLGDLSIRLKSGDDQDVLQILDNFKQIGEKMGKTKLTQINIILLQKWTNTLNKNCQKLIKIVELNNSSSTDFYKSTKREDNTLLQQQLVEEKKNRLLVEEQTSLIIQSQEAQIKQYIEKVKLLEQELLSVQ